jgi:hypothetical protein
LHIAVTSVEKLGSTRNVKALLLRGASRDAKDWQGKTPLDSIPSTLKQALADELRTQLSPQAYWECLMLRVPLIPLKKSHKTQALFIFMMALVYFLNAFIIFPTMDTMTSKYC